MWFQTKALLVAAPMRHSSKMPRPVSSTVQAQASRKRDFLETPGALSFSSLMAKRGHRVGAINVCGVSFSHQSQRLRFGALFDPWKHGWLGLGGLGPTEARKDCFAFQWCVIGVKKEAQAQIDSDERQPQSSMARSRWEERVAAIQMEGASCLTCKFPSCDATVGDRFSTYRPEKRRRSGRG